MNENIIKIFESYPITYWLEVYRKFYNLVNKIPLEAIDKYTNMISPCEQSSFSGKVKVYVHRNNLQKLFFDLSEVVNKFSKLIAKPMGGLELILMPYNIDYESFFDFFSKISSSEDIKVAGDKIYRASEEFLNLFSLRNIEPIIFNFAKSLNYTLFLISEITIPIKYPNIKEFEGIFFKKYLLYYLSKLLWSLRGYVFKPIGLGLHKLNYSVKIIPYTTYTRYLEISYSLTSYAIPYNAKERIEKKWKTILEFYKLSFSLKNPYYLLERFRHTSDTTKAREYLLTRILLKLFEYLDSIDVFSNKYMVFLMSLDSGKKIYESKLGKFLLKQYYLYNYSLENEIVDQKIADAFMYALELYLKNDNKDNLEEEIKNKYNFDGIDKIINDAKSLANKLKNAKKDANKYWNEIKWNISPIESITKTLRYKDYTRLQEKISSDFSKMARNLGILMQKLAKNYLNY